MSRHGETLLAGLIGDGITHSLTPYLHEQEGAANGISYIFRPIDLLTLPEPLPKLSEMLKYAKIFGFTSLTITHPHKQHVVELLDELSDDAAIIGAVNTVVIDESGHMTGHNTDWSGFAWGMNQVHPEADLSSVVLLGTGGAGSAVAYAMLKNGVQQLHLYDPDVQKSHELIQKFQPHFPHSVMNILEESELHNTIAQATGLINATPIGMHFLPGLPVPASSLHPQLWVSDVVYRPIETELITAAQQIGCVTIHGGNMAIGQAIDGFHIVSNTEPDSERMTKHFNQMLKEGR